MILMVYEPGEWSEEELKILFNFAPEEQASSDTDVLYSGEMIDVESGGINNVLPTEASRIVYHYSMIEPWCCNVISMPLGKDEEKAKKVAEKNREGIIEELTGIKSNHNRGKLKSQKIKIT